jgi:hypothetical protein
MRCGICSARLSLVSRGACVITELSRPWPIPHVGGFFWGGRRACQTPLERDAHSLSSRNTDVIGPVGRCAIDSMQPDGVLPHEGHSP